MRPFFYDFQIDSKPILTPDEDVQIVTEDFVAGDSDYDDFHVMHREVVKTSDSFVLQYSHLTTEEYQYMRSLVMGKNSFQINHRLYGVKVQKIKGYCDKFPAYLRNARTGTMKKLKFTVKQN